MYDGMKVQRDRQRTELQNERINKKRDDEQYRQNLNKLVTEEEVNF